MTPTMELLMAFVDGELSGEEASRIELLLKDRPDLRRYVDRQLALRRDFGTAFAAVLEDPIPDRLNTALYRAPVSWRRHVTHAIAHARATILAPGFPLKSAAPLAAALICGLIIGIVIGPQFFNRNPAMLVQKDGALVASGALANVLSNQLASEVSRDASLRVGVSFRARDGRDCRSFQSPDASSAFAGIACRDPSEWGIAMLARTEAQSAAEYRTAGSAMPDSIRDAIAGMIAGAPFDAAAERKARDHGWVAH